MDDSYKNTQASRLKEARIKAGFSTNAEAISRFGWVESTYNSHENGNRAFPLKRAKLYASAFKVDPYWLMDGTISIADQIARDSGADKGLAERRRRLLENFNGLSEAEQKKFVRLSEVFGEDD